MSTILTLRVPAEQFALAATFESLPEVEFHPVRLATQAPDPVSLLWATDVDPAAVREALGADPTTSDVSLVTRRNHDSLFRVRWCARVPFVTRSLVEENGAVVSARGADGDWTFRVLLHDRDAVADTYDACEAFDVRVEQIHPLDGEPSLEGTRLTDEQLATVRAALDRGYYAVPRETNLADLADELDISHQALSERLRRSHRALIESVVAP